MKARTLFLALSAMCATSVFAQSGAAKPIPMPATSPVATPAPSNLLPPPPVGAAAAPAAAPTGARNPMKPPQPAPAPAPVAAPAAQTLPPPGLPMPSIGKNPLPGMPAGAMDPDTDPVKANGKRIGTVNGKAIFKHEEAYFFDTETEKTKK